MATHSDKLEEAPLFDSAQIGPTTDAISDRSENMDVNLLDGAFSLSVNRNFYRLNQKIDNVTFDSCDGFVKDGFDLSIVDGQCSRCRSDQVTKRSQCASGQRRTTCILVRVFLFDSNTMVFSSMVLNSAIRSSLSQRFN